MSLTKAREFARLVAAEDFDEIGAYVENLSKDEVAKLAMSLAFLYVICDNQLRAIQAKQAKS